MNEETHNKTISFISSVIGWLKTRWVGILAIAGVAYLCFAGFMLYRKMGLQEAEMLNRLKQQQESHLHDMAAMQQSFAAQQRAQHEAEVRFSARLEELSTMYKDQLEAINRTRTTRQRNLISHPSELPGAIQATFGIPSGDTRTP